MVFMSSITHHFNRIVSRAAVADFSRLSNKTQKDTMLKVIVVAACAFVGMLIAGAAICAFSKIAGIAVIVASPFVAIGVGAYALSRFTEGFFINQVVNLAKRAVNYLDLN